MSTQVKYGNFEIDTAQIPQASLLALVSSGFAHKMGNEVASRVAAAMKKSEAPLTDEQKDALRTQYQSEMFEKILAGTLGVSTRTPGAPKSDNIKGQIVLKSLTAHLKAHGLAVPTKDKTLELGGKQYSREALLDAHYTKHQERLDAEITAEKKRREKETKKLAETVGEIV